MKIRELQHALAAESGDEEIDEDALPDESLPICVCTGLITVDLESDVVRSVHYTTGKYFRRIRETRFPTARIKITKTYFSFRELMNPSLYTLRYRNIPFENEVRRCCFLRSRLELPSLLFNPNLYVCTLVALIRSRE